MRCSLSHIIIGIILFILLCLALPTSAQKIEKVEYFQVLNTRQGLSDNNILQMMQLPDNRLAVRTQKGIDIYDGRQFRFIPLSAGQAQRIDKYEGQTHLYADNHHRLWIKERHQVSCVDLNQGKVVELSLEAVEDLFVDSRGNVWTVKGDTVINATDGNRILLVGSWGSLQDLDTDGKNVYTFHESGKVAAFKDGKLIYTVSAYSPSEALHYRNTSLTVQTPSGQFYQIRTGREGKDGGVVSVFLHFDPETRKFTKIFSCPYILHTLNMASDNQALISSQRGYLMFDFKVGNAPREVRELALPDGRSLVTGINTVYRDREGAIWLGTYNDGLIYVSPMLGLFFTIDKPWWQLGWGVFSLVLIAVILIVVAVLFLYRQRKRKGVKENIELIPSSSVEEPELIQKVRSLVEQHLSDGEYGVEQLANDLCMERTGLYKKLTALTNTTPVSFIRSIRLQRASELLKTGGLTVNDIADRTGFSSPSYFTKCFKKEYGMLPSEYK